MTKQMIIIVLATHIQIIFITFASMKPQHIILSIIAAACLAGGPGILTACSEKKKSDNNIITTKPTVVKKRATQSIGDYTQRRDISWLGSTYTIATERKADPALPLAQDEQGNRYYDNRITVTISRKDGSVFFQRTFSKADFAQYTHNAFAKDGALLGVVFNEAKGDNLLFAASVGSPDNMSDNFIPIVVRVSRLGAVSMYEDSALDTSTDEANPQDAAQDDSDEGV